MQSHFRSHGSFSVKTWFLWDKCVSVGVGNTSVNVGNSLIGEARKENDNIILMGCPCHVTQNTPKKAMDAFAKINRFSIEKLLVDICFHFDNSSKRKNLFSEFSDFCD